MAKGLALKCTELLILIMVTVVLQGRALPIDEVKTITIGNVPQTIMVRGDNLENPLLLIFHGGPGYSEAMLFRSYNKKLEKNFVVVNWDQRGTHLSYNDSIPVESMNIPQFVSDAKELVDYLKSQYNKDKIFILGHSWGTVIGLKLAHKHPEDLYAYIGVGQLVNGLENERISLSYTLIEANKKRNREAIDELEAMASFYPNTDTDILINVKKQRERLLEFGGVFYRKKNYNSLFKKIDHRELELYDEELFAKGEEFTMKNMWAQIVREIDFFDSVDTLKIPVYFFIGHKDYNTPYTLTELYYNKIVAPQKRLVRFKRSGHFMPFEEPSKFNLLMKKIAKRY